LWGGVSLLRFVLRFPVGTELKIFKLNNYYFMRTMTFNEMEKVQGGWNWPSQEDWVCYGIGVAYGLACILCGAIAGAACMIAQDNI
jgi:hypothetical protein